MSQAAPEEPIAVVDPEAGVRSGRKDALQLIAEGIGDVFIGVEEEHPRSLDAVVSEVPIVLLWKVPVPAEMDPVCTNSQ